MEDREVDKHLTEHLSGAQQREAFKQQTLHNSTVEFVRVHRQRSAWRRVELAAAVILIASVAFLGGRLSASRTLPNSTHVPQWATDKSSCVNVSSELVAWLEAARLFKRLGMQDRMSRAVERAGRLLPSDTFIADEQTLQVFAAGSIGNQAERVEPTGILGPHPSAENINEILAQSFGD